MLKYTIIRNNNEAETMSAQKDGADESITKSENVPYLTDRREYRGSYCTNELLSATDTGSWSAKMLYIAFSDRSVNPAFLFMEMDYQPNQWADKVMKYSTTASFPASSI